MGGQAFLKLQPYIQTSVARRTNHKLRFKFFGPFPVIQSINDVTYELQLPANSSIFPVFHVSQLRHALTPGTNASSKLPSNAEISITPVQLLDRHWHRGACKVKEQGLIRWQGDGAASDTWEDLNDMQRWFLRDPTWGQAGFEEGGGVIDLTRRAASTQGPGRKSIKTSSPRRERRPKHKLTGP